MLETMSARRWALLVLALAIATIAGAWIFEAFGFLPCELCLKQRWAYYTAIPSVLVIAFLAPSHPALARNGLLLLGALWLASAVFGVYHSGVEWKWWPGPDTCTGTGGLSGGLPDLNAPVVMCDEPALRIFGLSLAGWNAVISLAAAAMCLAGARSHGSSSVSQ
jgi:disulfide bond formation protein DsbB